jgi:hypothetical protein
MERSQVLDIDYAQAPSIREAEVAAPAALDTNYVTRQEAARLAAVNIGIGWPKTILPEGTALYESGVEKLKSDRARWATLPYAADAIPAVREVLAAEDRRDIVAAVKDLRLRPEDGRVTVVDKFAPFQDINNANAFVGYDEHSFRQLAAQIPDLASGPRNTAGVLLHLSSAERAAIVNARVPESKSQVTVRTKVAHSGQRIARAFLSSRYADVNDYDVADAIGAALNGDGRIAKLDYKPGDSHSRFELFYPSEIPIETFRVGDIHRALVQVENSETGEGSVKVTAGLIRALCANLTTAFGEGVTVSIRHTGSTELRRGQMRAAIRAALAQLDPLVQAITVSARTAFPEGETASSLIEKLAAKYSVSDERATAWETTFKNGYAQSPTVWGLSSAISEAAQGQEWWHTQAEEEKVAAQLVHVHWKALN